MIQTKTVTVLVLIAVASVGLVGTAQQKVAAFGSNNLLVQNDHSHGSEGSGGVFKVVNGGSTTNEGTPNGNLHGNTNCNTNSQDASGTGGPDFNCKTNTH